MWGEKLKFYEKGKNRVDNKCLTGMINVYNSIALIEKFVSKDINLGPGKAVNTKGEPLPPLTNLGMEYVFEELIRRFNEENNEEAGEHFTSREIIRLMTHIVFLPLKEVLTKKGGVYSIYDPACGSGGMLTESEEFATEITGGKCKFNLFGQEVNPETYAICTSDMLIKDEQPDNIAFGSTLSKDGFPSKQFDFMLSNPPYSKSWKLDQASIINEKKKILDKRFLVGVPRVSDGQLLFLANMVSKMKQNTGTGSRIASVHNGSALFTGDAGGGESEIRRWLIENDWLECIIGLPKNMFYNTGISTYIFIINNRKGPTRKGKIQLIDATGEGFYQKMRKNLGNKGNEFASVHIDKITGLYTKFRKSKYSKIFKNEDFGYQKITVEQPLRLRVHFTREKVESLRFHPALQREMEWVYKRFKADVYTNLKPHKKAVATWLEQNEIKLKSGQKKNLLDPGFWNKQKQVMEAAQKLFAHFGGKEYLDYNKFLINFKRELDTLSISPGVPEQKQILAALSEKSEKAAKVIKKTAKDGTITYEPDPGLRDTEQVPLTENIHDYVKQEVLPHVPDAWIDESKTVTGYEISFTKYFYTYEPLRSLEDITRDIMELEKETEGLLGKILSESGE